MCGKLVGKVHNKAVITVQYFNLWLDFFKNGADTSSSHTKCTIKIWKKSGGTLKIKTVNIKTVQLFVLW
jgi:hypothetical protein